MIQPDIIRLAKPLRKAGTVVLCLAAIALFSIAASEAAKGAADGIEICIGTIIPSLFPMMFLSSFISRLPVANQLGRMLEPVVQRLFALPGACGIVLLMSLLGGYPAGAVTAVSLHKQRLLTNEQASRAVLICVSAGPAFIMGTVGAQIYSSAEIGALLLCAQIISVFAVGLAARLILPRTETNSSTKTDDTGNADISTVLVDSAGSTARTMLSVCVFIVLFSVINRLLEHYGILNLLEQLLEMLHLPDTFSSALLPALMEVSAGCVSGSRVGIAFVAFLIGFGGFSVHFQIYAVCSTLTIRKSLFLAFRLLQGLVCALLCALGLHLMPEHILEAAAYTTSALSASTAQGAVCLLIMCVMAILTLPAQTERDARLHFPRDMI